MANKNLTAAKKAKNDEFYTQLSDVQAEMNAYVEYNPDVFRGKTILCPSDDPGNSAFSQYFIEQIRNKTLGIKRLICTSYANSYLSQHPSKTEKSMPCFDESLHYARGRLFVVDADSPLPDNAAKLSWQYLEGDGDFRSEEVTKLRDEIDIIITNPAFSLFREFLAWIMEGKKQFSIIGNQNAITYKEVFPLIKDNKVWLGNGFRGGNAFFKVCNTDRIYADGVYDENTQLVKFRNCLWFTNIDHGKRHEPMHLMTMADNLKYNKKLIKKLPKDENGKPYYPKYDNFDALEVPITEAIPSDYEPCWFHCPHANTCIFAKTDGKEDDALCEQEAIDCPPFAQIQNAMESLESQSQRLDESTLQNIKSLEKLTTDPQSHMTSQNQNLMENMSTNALLFKKCNGQIGVPITAMSKLTEEYEIVGSDYELSNPIALDDGNVGRDRFYLADESNHTHTHTHSADCMHESLFARCVKCKGVMGYPITALGRINVSEYRIIGIANSTRWIGEYPCFTIINRQKIYNRILIQKMPRVDWVSDNNVR